MSKGKRFHLTKTKRFLNVSKNVLINVYINIHIKRFINVVYMIFIKQPLRNHYKTFFKCFVLQLQRNRFTVDTNLNKIHRKRFFMKLNIQHIMFIFPYFCI